MNEAQTLVGVIENIELKDGKKQDGNAWRLHKFKIRSPAGTRSYATFDKGWPTNLIGGETYRFTFTEKQDGEFTNYTLTGAIQVDPSEFGAQPASNGTAREHYDPPTDEAKARVATSEPQPEFKSPSRSYDQNQDIQEENKHRRTAVMQAVELFKDTFAAATPQESTALVLQCADDLFAWLQDTSVEASDRSAEPVAEAGGTGQQWQAEIGSESDGGPAEEGGTPSYGTTKPDSSGGSFITPPRESDGGPPLFPPEQASKSPEAKPHITNMVGLLRVLKKDFRLGKEDLPKIETILKRAGMKPLAESTNLQAVYDEIDRDFAQAEAAYREEQTQPIANTEA